MSLGSICMVMQVITTWKWHSSVLLESSRLFGVLQFKPQFLFNLNWLLHLVRLSSGEYHAYSFAAKESEYACLLLLDLGLVAVPPLLGHN